MKSKKTPHCQNSSKLQLTNRRYMQNRPPLRQKQNRHHPLRQNQYKSNHSYHLEQLILVVSITKYH